MTTQREAFIWYELMTPDATAAAKFYGAVVGWKIPLEPAPLPDGKDYRMVTCSDGEAAGGVLQLDAHMLRGGATPRWLPYLYVENVDQALAALTADGARVLLPRTELPVGPIAMVADPAGAPFYVMTPVPPPGKAEARSGVFDRERLQRVGWNELASDDLAKVRAFYAKHFGFGVERTMPMGEFGDYVFLDVGEQMQGGLMQHAPQSHARTWVPYFNVRSAAAAQQAIGQGGGRVLMPAHQVPGGRWVVVAADPQGAVFGVTAERAE